MKSLVSAAVHSHGGSPSSRRLLARLLGIAPVALLLIGLAVISAGPLARPAAAANPSQTTTHGLGGQPTQGLPQGISAVAANLAQATTLPDSVDLSEWDPPVGYQGQVNSCSSWATGYYYRYWLRNHADGETSTFAPMYLYSQIAQGNVNRPSTFPENFNIMESQGIDHEVDYSQGEYNYTTQPTSAEVTAAAPYKVTSDSLLFSGANSANKTAVEASLAAGQPVLLLIPDYPNFDAANATGPFIDVPAAGTSSRGYHAVFAPKYDAAGVWIENSWGTSWGQSGYGELSWAFVNQYAVEGWNMTADTQITGATYHALTPARVLDSRDGYWIGLSGAFSSHVARTFTVSGHGGVPSNAIAVTGNLTVTGQTALGYLYVGPNAMDNPTSSTLNFPLGDDRANAVTVALGAGGTLSVTYVAAPGASAQVIFDVTGYFVK